MSEVSGVGYRQRSTEDLLDEVAHDAKLVGPKEHMHSGATQPSAAKAWSGRHDKNLAGDAKHIGEKGAVQGGELALDKALEHGSILGGAAAAGPLVAAGSLWQLKFLLQEGWLKPNMEGDRIRAAQTNDALNVGVARALDAPPGFKGHVAASRPGVETGAAKVTEALKGKEAGMVPVLQARADEGFVAMEKLMADTKNVPAEAKNKARLDGIAKLNERAKTDVAFGLGVQLYAWSEVQGASTVSMVSADVHARAVPRPVHTRG